MNDNQKETQELNENTETPQETESVVTQETDGVSTTTVAPTNDNSSDVDESLPHNEQTDKEKVLLYLGRLKSSDQVESDDDINVKLGEGLSERSKVYSAILGDYEKSIKHNFNTKKKFKVAMFVVSLVILCVTTICTFAAFIILSVLGTLESLSVIIPLLISFLTVFIVIPQIIANYLYNKDEEKYMVEIINNLLKHDLDLKEHLDKGKK